MSEPITSTADTTYPSCSIILQALIQEVTDKSATINNLNTKTGIILAFIIIYIGEILDSILSLREIKQLSSSFDVAVTFILFLLGIVSFILVTISCTFFFNTLCGFTTEDISENAIDEQSLKQDCTSTECDLIDIYKKKLTKTKDAIELKNSSFCKAIFFLKLSFGLFVLEILLNKLIL